MFSEHHIETLCGKISDLTKAIDSLVSVTQLENSKVFHDCVNKHDLRETEKRIIAAIGSADPAQVAKLTAELKAASDPLKAAVDATPK